MTRAAFIGRFQPFHLGHLHVVRTLAQRHDEVVVAVGSAQVSHTADNPFTAGERVEMIAASLAEAGVRNVVVVPLPDVGRNSVWVSHVKSYLPRFDVLYSNNPLMQQLFGEAGERVEPAPFHERERYEGTRIRGLMVEGADWEGLVPKAVARVVAECGGIERLRRVASEAARVEGRDPSVGG